jgi:hypothetical protein
MYRLILVVGLAVIGVLPLRVADAGARPKPHEKPRANQRSEIHVTVKARCYEVDEPFHEKLATARWRSRADLEELETKPPLARPLFALLEKQKAFLVGKETNIDPGKKGVLLTATRPINCLPTPDQLRQGKNGPQTIDEGFTLGAEVHISADRRFVRARFLEKSLEIEGIEKVEVVVDEKGIRAVGGLFRRGKLACLRRVTFPTAGAFCCLFSIGRLRSGRRSTGWSPRSRRGSTSRRKNERVEVAAELGPSASHLRRTHYTRMSKASPGTYPSVLGGTRETDTFQKPDGERLLQRLARAGPFLDTAVAPTIGAEKVPAARCRLVSRFDRAVAGQGPPA